MYVSHLAEACIQLGIDVLWPTPAVYGAAKGPANAIDWSLKFDNYMTLKLFRRVVIAETLAADFGKFMYLAFLYIARGPSEDIPSRRAPLSLPLGAKAPQCPNAFVGIRTVADGSSRIALKRNVRKNRRGPVPLSRPCFLTPIPSLITVSSPFVTFGI